MYQSSWVRDSPLITQRHQPLESMSSPSRNLEVVQIFPWKSTDIRQYEIIMKKFKEPHNIPMTWHQYILNYCKILGTTIGKTMNQQHKSIYKTGESNCNWGDTVYNQRHGKEKQKS